MKIIAVGDIMPGGVLNGTKREFISNDLKAILNDGDIRVGTLETAIGNTPDFNEEKMRRKADVIYAKDEDLLRLKELNINIVSLANNHFTDLGIEGARHTIQLLDQMGIMHCGAGDNIEEASKPVTVNHGGESYAFLAFCDWREETVGWCPFASETQPGVNPMTDDYVVSEIKKYKNLYDYVIVIPHWGIEYVVHPSINVYRLAKKMIDAGADLILGGHTHCIQPIWKYKGKPVVFSMGNFLFPDRLLTTPRSTYYSDIPLDYDSLPVTYEYPRYVNSVTLKKWKSIARYGQMTIVDLSRKYTNLSTKVTHLTNENIVELYHEKLFFSNKIRLAEMALKTGLYPGLLFLKSSINRLRRLIR